VVLLTYGGDWIRQKVLHRFIRKRKRFSQKSRKFVTIWKRYGLAGVAFLTPILLTPIGGTILAVSSGSPKERIILFMFVSASVWSVVFSVVVYFFGSKILPDYIR
jgi:membrane protein DedA with SNARE-associated domain